MRRRELLTRASAGAVPIVAGCTGGGGGNDGGGMEQTTTTTEQMDGGTSSDTTVEMKNTSFNPVKASVGVGGTVEWVNNDSFKHDVTSVQFSDGAASWDVSKTVAAGESVTHTFENAGFYEYYCTIHGKGTMCGVVVVGDVSYTGSLPCQDGGDGGGGGGGYY